MSAPPALTQFTRFSGCGAKLGPGVLDEALCGLVQPAYPGLLADFAGGEDAGLFRLGPDLALVQTVDFFPPIVDDPRLFGRIAAANALSDIYAMGARPTTPATSPAASGSTGSKGPGALTGRRLAPSASTRT